MSDTSLRPDTVLSPTTDGDHERFAHYVAAPGGQDPGALIMEAMVTGTPVRALCGKIWVPSRDPKKYPVCPECKEILGQARRNKGGQ